MEPEAKFYDDLIKEKPTLSSSTAEIVELISSYNNCYTSFRSAAGSCDPAIFVTPAKADLRTIIMNLSTIFTNLKNDITDLENNVDAKLEQIESERDLKNVNSGIFNNINTSNSGAKIMIDDYKTTYNSQYYKNIELVIGVFILLGLSFKIFRK
jgi:hypothetical protein